MHSEEMLCEGTIKLQRRNAGSGRSTRTISPVATSSCSSPSSLDYSCCSSSSISGTESYEVVGPRVGYRCSVRIPHIQESKFSEKQTVLATDRIVPRRSPSALDRNTDSCGSLGTSWFQLDGLGDSSVFLFSRLAKIATFSTPSGLAFSPSRSPASASPASSAADTTKIPPDRLRIRRLWNSAPMSWKAALAPTYPAR